MGALVPISLRSLFVIYPELLTHVLRVIQRLITTHLMDQAGIEGTNAATGAVSSAYGDAEPLISFIVQLHVARTSTSNRFVFTSGTLSF